MGIDAKHMQQKPIFNIYIRDSTAEMFDDPLNLEYHKTKSVNQSKP